LNRDSAAEKSHNDKLIAVVARVVVVVVGTQWVCASQLAIY